MIEILLGATAMAFGVVGLHFLKFWRKTGDRLFLTFATAFGLLGVNRIAVALAGPAHETHTVFSVVRLVAYLLILIGIAEKNRAKPGTAPTDCT